MSSKYRIAGVLGHGSFGEVRLCIDKSTGEKVCNHVSHADWHAYEQFLLINYGIKE